MKVIVVDPLLFTAPYDKAICGALIEAGHSVFMVGRKLKDQESWDEGHGRYFELPLGEPNPPTPGSMLYKWYWFAQHILYIASLAKLLVLARRVRADIVHIQWALMPVFDIVVIRILNFWLGTVLTQHDSVVANGDNVSRLRRLGGQALVRSFGLVITHTGNGYDRLVKQGVDSQRAKVIPLGLFPIQASLSRIGREHSSEIVSFLVFGIIKPYKGIDVLIKAVALLDAHTRAHCKVIVAGKPAIDVNYLLDLAEKSKVRSSFDFRFGHVPDSAIPSLYSEADVLVYPYLEIEASAVFALGLSYGLPVIASAIGLFKEVLKDEVHGKLVAPNDVQALAQALTTMVQRRAFRQSSGYKIRELASSIPSWSKIGLETSKQYAGLISYRADGRRGR